MKKITIKNLNCFPKMYLKSFLLITLSLFVISTLKAQEPSNTAYAIASATIVTEMAGVEKLDDINFTNIMAGEEGTVSGNSGLKIVGGDNAYSVTLSNEDITVKKDGSKETMEVNLINSISNTLDHTFTINAAVNVNSNQSAGAYTSVTPLMVTINYN